MRPPRALQQAPIPLLLLVLRPVREEEEEEEEEKEAARGFLLSLSSCPRCSPSEIWRLFLRSLVTAVYCSVSGSPEEDRKIRFTWRRCLACFPYSVRFFFLTADTVHASAGGLWNWT